MTNNTDELAALWQTQSVQEIDVARIQRELRSQRWKQRLYMLVDVLGPVPLALVLYYSSDKLPLSALIIIWATLIISVPFVIYFLWLRRHAAFTKAVDTRSHVNVLYRQVANNAKIAFYTKHSCWVSSVMLIVFFGGEIFKTLSGNEEELSLVRIVLWLGAGIAGCFGCYIWARNRERKFKARMDELAAIQSQLNERHSALHL